MSKAFALTVLCQKKLHNARLDEKTIFEYPEDGGSPIVTGIHTDYYYSTRCDTVICGVRLKYSTPKLNGSTDGYITEYMGQFPLKSDHYKNGKVVDATKYKYNSNLDEIQCIKEYYDNDGSITKTDKDTLYAEDGYQIYLRYEYDADSKKLLPFEKTKTKRDSDGWIVDQYTYFSDNNGNFGDYSYGFSIDKKGEKSNRGKMTQYENGERKTFDIMVDYVNSMTSEEDEENKDNESYLSKYYNEDLRELVEDLNYAYIYKLDSNGNKDAKPYLIKQKVVTFNNQKNGYTKYNETNITGLECINRFYCKIYNTNGDIKYDYAYNIKGFKDIDSYFDAKAKGYPSIYLYDFNGTEYSYFYNEDGENVGLKSHKTIASRGYTGGSTYSCVRDLNYRNVAGVDDICPIIYSKSDAESLFASAINIYYYSSENGTLIPSGINDITDNTEQNATVIYDVNGKIIRTCADGNVSLPDAHGIYIIKKAGNVTKVKK